MNRVGEFLFFRQSQFACDKFPKRVIEAEASIPP